MSFWILVILAVGVEFDSGVSDDVFRVTLAVMVTNEYGVSAI